MPALVDLTCREAVELVSSYLAEGAMPPPDRACFEEHLHACPWCMTYLKQVEQTVLRMPALAAYPDDVNPATEAKLLQLFRGWAQSAAPAVSGAWPAHAEPTQAAPAHAATAEVPARLSASATPSQFAFKFLERGAGGPISRFPWPLPGPGCAGAWVRAELPLAVCGHGIHACTREDVSRWLHDELWLVELRGQIVPGIHALVAEEGRLVRKVEAWDKPLQQDFLHAVHAHALAVASAAGEPAVSVAPYLASSARHIPLGNTALGAYCAAMAVARVAGGTRFAQAGYDRERDWQSRWLTDALSLDAVLTR